MSGGTFNYLAGKISYACEDLESIIEQSNTEHGYELSDETLAELRNGLAALKLAAIYERRIDWLLASDDSEESFHRRLKKELDILMNDHLVDVERPNIIFQKADDCPDVINLPKYQTQLAAAFDLQSAETVTIRPNSKKIIRTGLRALIPTGYYVRIESRSGLSAKFSMEKGAGIIDADYCDEWRVILYNHGDTPQHIVAGDRIAQAIVAQCIQAEIQWGKVPAKHPDSDRNGGFGSTGV